MLLKDIAKLGIDVAEGSLARVGRAVGIVDFPVPRNSHIRKTGGRWLHEHHQKGIRTYLPIATMAIANGVDLNRGARVLDFGCGVGRQLSHFVKSYPASRFSACDIDADMIAFIQKSYPTVDAYVSAFQPPLRWADGSFDLIYTVSTFSHFAPADVAAWLRELGRLLAPGGLLVITTEGEVAAQVDPGQLTDAMVAEVKATGIAYREYTGLETARQRRPIGGVGDTAKGITGSYGNTLLTIGYVRRIAAECGLSVRAVGEGVIDNRQDLFVLGH